MSPRNNVAAGAETVPAQARQAQTRQAQNRQKAAATVDLAALRSVIDNVPSRVMLCDRDLVIRYVNKASMEGLRELEAYLPISAEEVLGANIDIFHKNPAFQRGILASPENLPRRNHIQVGPQTLDLAVQPIYDDAGTYVGAMASWDNITEVLATEAARRDAEIDAAAVNKVLTELTAARTSDEAIQIALDSVRESYGWAYSSFWALDENDNALKFQQESGSAGEEFARVTRAASFREGVGLSGRAWQNRDLFFTPDIGEMTDCVRAPIAQRVGVKSGVCFPITIEGKVAGTMDFFMLETIDPSRQRLDALRNVGHLVSQAIERVRKEEADRNAADDLRARVAQMLDVVSAAAAGDLTRDIAVTGDDAIGQMGEGLAAFFNTLRASMSEIGHTAQALAAAGEELSAVSEQMIGNATSTSSQAENASGISSEVASNIETVATAAEQMTASIAEIARNASSAADVAGQAVEGASSANRTVSNLGDSSQEIGKVIKVITSIAQQTNLLALNATIEAARAGEAGKGFAVVANEVKELAKETARATEDISQKIEAIQADTTSAVTAIGQISTVINQISDIQNTISSAVEEQTATTNEIARSVSSAASGSQNISRSITTVAEAAQSTRQGAEDSQRAAAELAAMAAELQRLLGQFHY
jgi:methyl-accepting chemotaxis protein